MSKSLTKCWICGDDATTREHKIKRSDLRGMFGTATQAAPLFYNSDKIKNRWIGSLDAKLLKFSKTLCAKCNSTRTKPHDKAWEHMSHNLRTRAENGPIGDVVHANRIFRYDTKRKMRNIHLFFVKQLGCHIVENNIPFDISAFAHAILNEKACPYFYLRFGWIPPHKDIRSCGPTDMWTGQLNGTIKFAQYFLELDFLPVNVMFAADGEKRDGLINAWHPRSGSNRLVLTDFS